MPVSHIDELYSYNLPQHLIGNSPKEKRDESRLFVFDTKTGEIVFDLFKNIHKYLPENALLVLNETRVVPARAHLYKKTGGKVEVLFLVNLWDESERIIKGMVDRKIEAGDTLSFGDEKMKVLKQDESVFYFEMSCSGQKFRGLLTEHGETPVPHYIKRVSLDEEALRTRYQSVFAKDAYSIAAPTASLHFTEEVFSKLLLRGIEKTMLTLHVGLGTFKPLTKENFETNSLHNERFAMGEESLQKIIEAKENARPLVAVGTTTVRTLESFAVTKQKEGETAIFIHPPYDFKMVDHMITNFHLPNSSLMMLVEAFLQHKKSDKHLVELYEVAIKEGFHFYSFGDSMLIL